MRALLCFKNDSILLTVQEAITQEGKPCANPQEKKNRAQKATIKVNALVAMTCRGSSALQFTFWMTALFRAGPKGRQPQVVGQGFRAPSATGEIDCGVYSNPALACLAGPVPVFRRRHLQPDTACSTLRQPSLIYCRRRSTLWPHPFPDHE